MCFFKKKKAKQAEQPENENDVNRRVSLQLNIPENMYNDLKRWAAVEYRTIEEEVENILAVSLYRHDSDPELSRTPNRYQGYIKKETKKKAAYETTVEGSKKDSKK